MNFLRSSLILILALTLQSSVTQAVRMDDSGSATERPPSRIQKALEAKLFQEISLPKVGPDRLAIAIDRVNLKLNESNSPSKDFLTALIDQQFEGLSQPFSPEVKERLKELWRTDAWIHFSQRAEHTLESEPTGGLHGIASQYPHLFLDDRIAAAPYLLRLIKMIVLTHSIGPQLQILETQGIAFYRETYRIQASLNQISSYWTLLQWLNFVRIQKYLVKEIRSSNAPLTTIRYLLDYIDSKKTWDNKKTLNQFLSTHVPMIVKNEEALQFLQNWLDDAVLNSAYEDVRNTNKNNGLVDQKDQKNISEEIPNKSEKPKVISMDAFKNHAKALEECKVEITPDPLN